jgi:peptide/nickel transport system substrate-binding protein
VAEDSSKSARAQTAQQPGLDRKELIQRTGVAVAALYSAGTLGDLARSAAAQPSPKRGGKVRLAMGDSSSGDSLDPGKVLTSIGLMSGAMVFDNLITQDDRWRLTPALAREWSVDKTGRTWTLSLRQGVRFHDGKPLTSQDVVYTLRRILDPKAGSAGLSALAPFVTPSGIVARDAQTVTITLKKPNYLLPSLLAQSYARIVQSGEKSFKLPAGTGPFIIKSFTPGTGFRVVRNPSYWRGGLPYLDEIEVVDIAEPSTRVQSVISGASTACDFVQQGALQTAQRANLRLLRKNAAEMGPTLIFDRRVKPYSNPDVIQALKLLIDRKAWNQLVLSGLGEIGADVPIAPDDTYYAHGLKVPKADTATAKELLKSAGASNLRMDLWTYSGSSNMVAAAVAFRELASEANIRVKVIQGNLDLYFTKGWLVAPAVVSLFFRQHPMQVLPLAYRSNGAWNEQHWNDKKLDAMIDSVPAQRSRRAQTNRLHEIQRYINTHTTGIIPGWGPHVWPLGKQLRGLQLSYTDVADFSHVYLA